MINKLKQFLELDRKIRTDIGLTREERKEWMGFDETPALEKLIEAVEIIQMIERNIYISTCPICDQYWRDGHDKNCKLGNFLAEMEGDNNVQNNP